MIIYINLKMWLTVTREFLESLICCQFFTIGFLFRMKFPQIYVLYNTVVGIIIGECVNSENVVAIEL